MQEYYTTQQAAELLQTTQRTVYRWIQSGRLEANKTAGGGWRITAAALLSFIGEPERKALEQTANGSN